MVDRQEQMRGRMESIVGEVSFISNAVREHPNTTPSERVGEYARIMVSKYFSQRERCKIFNVDTTIYDEKLGTLLEPLASAGLIKLSDYQLSK